MIQDNLLKIVSENEKSTKKLEILQRFQQNLNKKSVEDTKDLKKLITEENDYHNLMQKLNS